MLTPQLVMHALLALFGYVLIIVGLALGLDELVFRPARHATRILDEDDRLPIVPLPDVHGPKDAA